MNTEKDRDEKSFPEWIEKLKAQAKENGYDERRSLTEVIEDMQDQAAKRGLTPEILQAILDDEDDDD